MRIRFLFFTFAVLIVLTTTASTQVLNVPVTTTVPGYWVSSGNIVGSISGLGNNQLLLIDTTTGNFNVLMELHNGIYSPIWSPLGESIAFQSFESDAAIEIYNLDSQTASQLYVTSGYISTPRSWSPDQTNILSTSYNISTGVGVYELFFVDINNGSSTSIFSYTVDSLLSDVPLPPSVTSFNFLGIEDAGWNPVLSEWIFVQLSGYDENLIDIQSGYPLSLTVNFLVNLQTGEKISIDSVIQDQIFVRSIQWSPDGKNLALLTSKELGTTQILRFENINGNWQLSVDKQTRTLNHAPIKWLGVDDLLITTTSEGSNRDFIYHISQIIDGQWFTTEFFRKPDTMFERVEVHDDWHISAVKEEQHSISCLFDQALPTQLSIGARARVNFTDGTPLRLRDAPSFDANEVTQMAEGTEFDIIGGKAESYYRFWQLELDNGTTGWAAEANLTDYFMEPVTVD